MCLAIPFLKHNLAVFLCAGLVPVHSPRLVVPHPGPNEKLEHFLMWAIDRSAADRDMHHCMTSEQYPIAPFLNRVDLIFL
jgi:hypothetical protein